MMYLVIASIGISVLTIACMVFFHIIDIKNGHSGIMAFDFIGLIIASLIPLLNVCFLFISLDMLAKDIMPFYKRQRKEKKSQLMKQLKAINQPYECNTCGVYTRQGYIDLFNIGNTESEKRCPNCEQLSYMIERDLPANQTLMFAEAFTLKDIKGMTQKTTEQAQDFFDEKQKANYLKARELKMRGSMEKCS